MMARRKCEWAMNAIWLCDVITMCWRAPNPATKHLPYLLSHRLIPLSTISAFPLPSMPEDIGETTTEPPANDTNTTTEPPANVLDLTVDAPPETLDLTIDPPADLVPPQTFQDRLPGDDLTIADFLRCPMPPAMAEDSPVLPGQATSCVSSMDPTYTMDDVFRVEVPTMEWLRELEAGVQARRERVETLARGRRITSVVHPTQRGLVFPIWILRAWTDLRPIALEWSWWQQVTRWLDERGNSILAAQAKELVAETRRNTANEDILVIALLTSARWLWDRHFQVVGGMLNEISAASTPKSWTLPPEFGTTLRDSLRAGGAETISENENIRAVAKHLEAGNYRWCFIPTFLKAKKHWILFEIDLKANTFAWGAPAVFPS